MSIAHISVKIKEDKIDSFLELARSHTKLSAEEPGAVMFQCLRSVSDPSLFIFVEEFESEEAFQAHRNSPHFKKFQEIAPKMILEKSKAEFEILGNI